ncbi:CA2 (predicted) [Pycnogonum litorale]
MGSRDDDCWGYEETNGPDTWYSRYPSSRGNRQSPINIELSKVNRDRQMSFSRPLSCNYQPKCQKFILTNTGASWMVKVIGRGSVLEGGPLGADRYELVQFHSHWGKLDDKGSEHTVNGKQYAAEIHFVHYNSDKYTNFEQAATQPDGLAVLGVFLQLGGSNHKELSKLTSELDKVKSKDVEFEIEIDPIKLFPKEDRSYWTYDGSLTTPPCHESVTWLIYKTPIEISWEQLQTFRQLECVSCKKNNSSVPRNKQIVTNCRPTQPVAGRIVKEVSD